MQLGVEIFDEIVHQFARLSFLHVKWLSGEEAHLAEGVGVVLIFARLCRLQCETREPKGVRRTTTGLSYPVAIE